MIAILIVLIQSLEVRMVLPSGTVLDMILMVHMAASRSTASVSRISLACRAFFGESDFRSKFSPDVHILKTSRLVSPSAAACACKLGRSHHRSK